MTHTGPTNCQEGASRGERSDPRLREARGTGPNDERPNGGASPGATGGSERRAPPGRAELVCGTVRPLMALDSSRPIPTNSPTNSRNNWAVGWST
jgi:hypothetical protein